MLHHLAIGSGIISHSSLCFSSSLTNVDFPAAMFPSMEIFLRRFWKLESREPLGPQQRRLAGVDMVEHWGQPAAPARFKSPAKRWAGGEGCLLLPPAQPRPAPPRSCLRPASACRAFLNWVLSEGNLRVASFRKLLLDLVRFASISKSSPCCLCSRHQFQNILFQKSRLLFVV